ncbi:MAG: hypothetical protein KGL39_09290 [Patescibacteria group bacterium]|nr:hypothetical protein [Patescibacteria group bacterium]
MQFPRSLARLTLKYAVSPAHAFILRKTCKHPYLREITKMITFVECAWTLIHAWDRQMLIDFHRTYPTALKNYESLASSILFDAKARKDKRMVRFIKDTVGYVPKPERVRVPVVVDAIETKLRMFEASDRNGSLTDEHRGDIRTLLWTQPNDLMFRRTRMLKLLYPAKPLFLAIATEFGGAPDRITTRFLRSCGRDAQRRLRISLAMTTDPWIQAVLHDFAQRLNATL